MPLCPVIQETVGGLPYLDLHNMRTRLAMGKSTDRLVDDTAGRKFIELCCDNGATTGDDARGIYNRLYITGAGGCGESIRSFTTVENVTAGASAHGAHLSLSFGATGKVTGLGVAARATLHIADQATQSGTMAAVMAEIWSDGDTSDPAGCRLSAIRVVNSGGGGTADVDDDCALLDFAGWTIGDGNMIAHDGSPGTCPNITHSIKCRMPDGTLAYMYLGASPVTA
jgi:hypothetical protein